MLGVAARFVAQEARKFGDTSLALKFRLSWAMCRCVSATAATASSASGNAPCYASFSPRAGTNASTCTRTCSSSIYPSASTCKCVFQAVLLSDSFWNCHVSAVSMKLAIPCLFSYLLVHFLHANVIELK